MESVIEYLIEHYLPSEVQSIMLKWRLFNVENFIPLLTKDTRDFCKKFLAFCNEIGLSWHDVVDLDLLLIMNFPEKFSWSHIKANNHCDWMTISAADGESACADEFFKRFVKRGIYLDVIAKSDGETVLWLRISRPESSKPCYLTLIFQNENLMIGSTGDDSLIKEVRRLVNDLPPTFKKYSDQNVSVQSTPKNKLTKKVSMKKKETASVHVELPARQKNGARLICDDEEFTLHGTLTVRKKH